MQGGTKPSASIERALKDALLSALRCRAPQALTWHNKVWGCPPHQLSAINCREVRSNGCAMSGKTCSLRSISYTWWRTPKTGQAGGLPLSGCCNAPDLQLGRRALS